MKNRNLTLLTDYYELTMMYGYFKKQMTKTQSVFDLFFQSKQREQLLHCGRIGTGGSIHRKSSF